MRDIHDVPSPEGPNEGAHWFDYAFEIATAQVADNGRLRIHAKADVGGAVAGFGVEVERSGWQRDRASADIWFDYGRGALFSTGAESDVFAHFLSAEIGDGRGRRFVTVSEADVAMLNSEPDAMLTKRCNTKFFLGQPDESEAQVFINFDIPNGLVELKEKDLDYRANLLAQLVIH